MSSKPPTASRGIWPARLLSFVFLIGSFFLLIFLSLRPQAAFGDVAGDESTPAAFLPLIHHPLPTATPMPMPDPPQVVASLGMPGASCSNFVEVNNHSGYVYVTNSGSDNVSIFRNREFVTNIPTSPNPTFVEPVPNSSKTYITVQQQSASNNQILYVDGVEVEVALPEYFEPFDVVYNPTNGYTYISDLDSRVTIYEGTTLIDHVLLPNSGWALSIVVDEMTGLTYVGSWERGMVFVLRDATVIDTFQVGWGIYRMVLDQERGYFYVAHSSPSATYPQNISVFERDDYRVTAVSTAERSDWVDVDANGRAYFANPRDNTVTVMNGRQLVGNISVGERPIFVKAHPQTNYVLVANSGGSDVSILRDGAFVTNVPTFTAPQAVGVDETNGDIYVTHSPTRVDCSLGTTCPTICLTPKLVVLK